MATLDAMGRKIAGLLTYNPGPGIYSRLERAIQAMPENVRVQELPGLLKRHKEGVPGWELKAVDLDSLTAGRVAVPREELLARVRAQSPVYTHGEMVLGGTPQYTIGVPHSVLENDPRTFPFDVEDVQDGPSPLGLGVHHGDTAFGDYGQGGTNYTELLLTQPNAGFRHFGSHWNDVNAAPGAANAVAHARYDTHGDALRINELQSDLGIHNRKAREFMAGYQEAAENMPAVDLELARREAGTELTFPLEDAWSDILIKRLALEAARQGHRAIEVAAPRAIADKVGGNIDNYEHFYGKVVPGALERLGRKMGGLVDATPDFGLVTGDAQRAYASRLGVEEDSWRDLMDAAIDRAIPAGPSGRASHQLAPTMRDLERNFDIGVSDLSDAKRDYAYRQFEAVARQHLPAGGNAAEAAGAALRDMMPYLKRAVEAGDDYSMAKQRIRGAPNLPISRRYIMSDEMRRRLLEQGVGAAIMAPLLMQDGE